MSGNMSNLHRENSVDLGRPPLPSSGSRGDRSFLSTSYRRSFSFTGRHSFLSFGEGTSEKEIYSDRDVWGTRLILSALEDIAFDETSFPKLSPSHVLAIQKFLLSVHSAAFNRVQYVEQEKTQNSSQLQPQIDTSGSVNELKLDSEVLDELNELPKESKIVIRSLVSTYIRNLGVKILEQWAPVLEAEGKTLRAPITEKKKPGDGSSNIQSLKEAFAVITAQLKSYQSQSNEFDGTIQELMKCRSDELKKLERDTDYYKQLVEEILKEESIKNDPELLRAYFEFIELEKQCLREELRLEELKQDAAENPIEEQEETKKLYKDVKTMYEQMLAESKDMEEKLTQYKNLGADYTAYFDKYQDLEEKIKTKEWVKEQLQNGPKDDSLFNDSDSLL